ncbi:metal ABC transporter substrate-binding protein [Tissierella sp. Yu-01]|uniref:metal ABC transporter substrate-binding protein n=1 Tax=Tissierella sp. Yu-01 TaxID=3035694 RepID=UPI00240D4C0B|nr:metal ABC transporter substrate-binding protein [Tissierella sp. Yu-01]WFA08933.1 metal ABC transporter substrate-binding protein [Tissierella sp. Yu-01]
MKQILSIFLIIVIVIVPLVGCQSLETNNIESNKIKVVTTIFPQYDFVRQIAGNNVDLTMLLKPGMESHSYEPSPQDIIKIQEADLFIYVGGENDIWVDEIIGSMGDQGPKTMKLIDYVDTVMEEIVEGMEHDHDHEHNHEEEHDQEVHEEHDHEHSHEEDNEDHEDHDENHEEEVIDEHVWTSPKNAIEIVNAITENLSNLDPDNEENYRIQGNDYIKKLNELDLEFTKVVNNSKRKTLVFGDRFPFRYFADEYGLEYYAPFSGCSSETEASASTIAFLIDKIKEENIPVVFKIELSNGKIAETLAEPVNGRTLTLHSCHNVTRDELEEGVTYLSLMEQNVETLKEALN